MIEQLSYKEMLELRLQLNNRLAAFENDAKEKLNQGIAVKGFVLKAGRKVRKVTNENTLVNALGKYMDYSDIYTAKMVGLPAIEKALKSHKLDGNQIEAMLAPHIDVSLAPSTMVYTGE